MQLGDKVCYESYLGCSDKDMIFGFITGEYGNSFIITDREGVEHTCYDKARLFKVDTFPLRCKKFCGCTVYEDGTTYTPLGKKARLKGNRNKSLFYYFGCKENIYTVARVVYKLFVEPDFDLEDKNTCITHKDGDYKNLHWTNLIKVDRQYISMKAAKTRKETRE